MLTQKLFAESKSFAEAVNYARACMRLTPAQEAAERAGKKYDEALAARKILDIRLPERGVTIDPEEYRVDVVVAERNVKAALEEKIQAEQVAEAWADAIAASKSGFEAWSRAVSEVNEAGFGNRAGNAQRVLRLFVAAEDETPRLAISRNIFAGTEAADLAAALHKCVFSFDKESGKWTAGKKDYEAVKAALQKIFDMFTLPCVAGEVLRKAKFDVKAQDVNDILTQYVTKVRAERKKDSDGFVTEYTGEVTRLTSIYARKVKGQTVYMTAALREQIAELLFAKLGKINK